ncbi:MAG: hypothetical protein HC911_12770 [Chloroflexaceae bacterium]|nr:hypothetical protein [Chloroflexaceae bacterium]
MVPPLLYTQRRVGDTSPEDADRLGLRLDNRLPAPHCRPSPPPTSRMYPASAPSRWIDPPAADP